MRVEASPGPLGDAFELDRRFRGSWGRAEEVRAISARLEQVVAGSNDIGGESRHIHAYQLASALTDLAGDHYGVDIRALDRLHDRADRVGHREDRGAIGSNHDDVGLF